jgi:hypothetical protein
MQRKPFHITISAASAHGLSLEGDMQLVKAALLYADEVKLCSFTSSMMLTMMMLKESDQKRSEEMLEALIPAMAQDKAEGERLVSLLRTFKQIGFNKNPTKQELQQRAIIQPRLARMRMDLKGIIERQLQESGISSFSRAIQTGLLEVHTFRASDTWDTEEMLNEFLEIIRSALSEGSTYPLFDDQAGTLVRTGLKGGQIQVSQAGTLRGKHSGLAARLFERLPVFDNASINEILDIRQELERPLIRFRSEIIKFSEGIRTAAWDEDFSFEAEQVFQRDVEPTLLDLEQALKTNKYVSSLIRKIADKPLTVAGGSALGILMSQLSALPDLASQAFGIGGAAGLVAYDAYKEWRTEQQNIEQNHLYFYYRSGVLLSNGTYQYRYPSN